MPVPLVIIPPIVAKILAYVLGAKILLIGISMLTAPTNRGSREAFLGHVKHVVEGRDKAEIGISQQDRVSLAEDLDVLTRGAEMGWTEEYESAALIGVSGFLSWAHARSTAYGVGNFAASHTSALGTMIWRYGCNIYDAAFKRVWG